jgi:hypothetical protein
MSVTPIHRLTAEDELCKITEDLDAEVMFADGLRCAITGLENLICQDELIYGVAKVGDTHAARLRAIAERLNAFLQSHEEG